MLNRLVLFVFLGLWTPLQIFGSPLGPRVDAQGRKTEHYIREGLFAGGDRMLTSVRLRDIRRSTSTGGGERIVFDLEAGSAELKSAQLMPYFQVQAVPNEHRIVVSIWSNVDFDFNSKKVTELFSKSKFVRKLNVAPRLEDALAIIEIQLTSQKGKSTELEAFYLTKPSRLILDLK